MLIQNRQDKLYAFYSFVIALYFVPIIALLLSVVLTHLQNEHSSNFVIISGSSMLPVGLSGFALSIIGLVFSIKKNSRLNKLAGITGIIIGLFYSIIFLFAWGLMYAVIGE